jgi:hypothetical protein
VRKLLLLFTLLSVLAATSASAGRPAPGGQGTLSIKDGKGMVQLSARGSMIGRFKSGKVTITDPNPYDARRAVVLGAERVARKGARTAVYSGNDVRIRIVGWLAHVRIEGRGIHLSAVGSGRGSVEGSGDPALGVFYDGVWSLNDEAYKSLPDELTGFQLTGPPQPARQ